VLQPTQDAAVVRQLEAIEEQLASTWKNHDCAGWGALLADDWSVTHIDAGDHEGSGARDVPYGSTCHVGRRSTGGPLVWRYGNRHRSD
jgi:hypothetical protein